MLRIEKLTRPGLGPIDLEIREGECVTLSGPSGAGKSLFLRAVADLDPNEGTVTLSGTERSELPAPDWRRRVGYLAAESGWWEETVAPHFPAPERVEDLIRHLGLDPAILNRQINHLSTGEKQRLALIRLMSRKPNVLLLDEPTAALDPKTRAKAEEMIRQFCQEGGLALVVTHDEDQAGRLAGRHLVIADGRLKELGA